MDIKCTGAMIECCTLPKGGTSSSLKRTSWVLYPSTTFLCMYFLFLVHRERDWLSTYPSVRHIPEWLPWFSYKKIIRVGRELGKQVKYPPIQFVKESMVSNYL